uniref:G_PROTEIN_RECEP_F1_2 domain-containing protein n=1 Tax=Steinernema glaseri TaxID=37863 RepID=A0A1I7Z5W0_9BILA
NVWYMTSTCVNIAVVFLYFRLLKMFKDKKGEYQKLNKSLSTMLTVYILGWLFTMTGGSFATVAAPDHKTFLVIAVLAGIPANFNIAAPFFIYYFRSTLYRQAFNKILGIKWASDEIVTTSNQVAPSQPEEQIQG